MAYQERITQLLDETEFGFEFEYEAPYDPYLYVLGLDPGGTTGVAMLRINTEDEKPKPELVYLHQIENGLQGFIDWFHGSTPSANTQIVSEKWKERNVKGANRTPQYIEGAMHWAWGDHTVWQYPDQKELVPDSWLKDNNLWTEGKRHQMDALKHAFAYLRNNGNSATVESLSGRGESQPFAEPGEAKAAEIQSQDGEQASYDRVFQEVIESYEKLGEASKKASERLEELNEILGGQGQGDHDYAESVEVEVRGTRSKRELNGAFTGYEPEGFDTGTTLFED